MLTMGIEHYDQPHAIFFILEVSNAFFTTVFGLGKFSPLNMVKCIEYFGKILSLLFRFQRQLLKLLA